MRHSILERLSLGEDAPSGGGVRADVEEIAEAIRRDLEELLNTRNSLAGELEDLYPEASRSVLAFGVEDIDGVLMTDKRDPELLKARIERAVGRFEPRLAGIRVKVVAAPRPLTQEIDLEIHASIVARDRNEQVTWNSVVKGGLALLRRA